VELTSTKALHNIDAAARISRIALSRDFGHRPIVFHASTPTRTLIILGKTHQLDQTNVRVVVHGKSKIAEVEERIAKLAEQGPGRSQNVPDKTLEVIHQLAH
jgi:predicted aldo/keto reductase-like oxidoreductase